MWRSQFTRNLVHVEFGFCKKATGSIGTRSYYAKRSNEMFVLNPTTPVYVNTEEGLPAYVAVLYPEGSEVVMETEGLNQDQVEDKVKQLVMAGINKRKTTGIGGSESMPYEIIHAYNPPRPINREKFE
eukprot:TRINITY_DN4863_c0_g1_i1.p1 TRINITY_DN4863_c0_g1~~TRINITY_DN4863_c0_g1_i1.p1  ORF type:complete len:128 (-),score=26.30 TRINITY_DN4863_c0_g1_i1:52-435(-)